MLTIVHTRCGTVSTVPAAQAAARARGVPIACVWCDGCGRAVRVAEVRWSDASAGLEVPDQARPGRAGRPAG